MNDFESGDFHTVLEEVRSFIAESGDTPEWFATAYVSWYRGKDRTVDLQGFMSLDSENKVLFCKMLYLRKLQGWRDQDLYEVEKFAIERWKL